MKGGKTVPKGNVYCGGNTFVCGWDVVCTGKEGWGAEVVEWEGWGAGVVEWER